MTYRSPKCSPMIFIYPNLVDLGQQDASLRKQPTFRDKTTFEERVQKFHSDDVLLPKSEKCF